MEGCGRRVAVTGWSRSRRAASAGVLGRAARTRHRRDGRCASPTGMRALVRHPEGLACADRVEQFATAAAAEAMATVKVGVDGALRHVFATDIGGPGPLR